MNASSQKVLPFHSSPDTIGQIIELPGERSAQILISEKEYLGLKCEVGYWQTMHSKAIEREKELKQKVSKLKGQIRDLRNRVFGKKSEKKKFQ